MIGDEKLSPSIIYIEYTMNEVDQSSNEHCDCLI